VTRLINAELSPARESEVRDQPIAPVLDLVTGDVMRRHLSHELADVIAHQPKLLPVIFFRRMDRDFRRRQPKDEPAAANVHVR
jgi:hypothetical protein